MPKNKIELKQGTKIWYKNPKVSPKKFPGIVRDGKIEIVGDFRDTFVFAKVPTFTDIKDAKIVSRRRKEYPNEENRFLLSKLGIEEEYVDMKQRKVGLFGLDNLTPEQNKLLNTINEQYSSGAYISYYTKRGFSEKDIDFLLARGYIHKQRSKATSYRFILCPRGESFY